MPETDNVEKNTSPRQSVWDDIVKWAESPRHPDWQSHAIQRIYMNRRLSREDGDIQEIELLLKDSLGIPVSLDGLKAERFRFRGDRVVAPVPVQLISMGNLVNVNAISPDQTISFVEPKNPPPSKPCGLVVIYGPNGSGKSGYSRVLKQACYARDSYGRKGNFAESAILPNVFARHNFEKTTAQFVWKVGDECVSVKWRDGERIADKLKIPMPPLAVFDSGCARAYVNENNEVVFRPYGLDILEELVRVCDMIRDDINAEVKVAMGKLEDLRVMCVNTEIGGFVDVVWHGTVSPKTVKSAESLADSFSPKERGRLADLKSIFAELDPRKKADVLRGQAKRIAKWNNEIIELARQMGDNALPHKLQKAVNSFVDASAAVVEINADDFGERPLQGTGGVLWEAMFKAAEEFSTEAYPDGKFPNVEKCMLCQQPLEDDGHKKLLFLQRFIRCGAAKIRDDWKAEIKHRLDDLRRMDLSPSRYLHASFLAEIKDLADASGVEFSALEKRIREFVEALADRQKNLLLSAESFRCDPLTSLPDSPVEELLVLQRWAESRANDLVTNRARREVELKELGAKEFFVRRKEEIVALIKLRLCVKSLNTTQVTNKARELSQKAVSEELTTRINSEIKRLGRLSGNRTFRTQSRHEKAKHKAQLALDSPSAEAHHLQDVLSEGEHRAVALACFFAETALNPNAVSCIVLDDPVSSMDKERARKVARRLEEEAKDRQIIVFTHDMSFSNLFTRKNVRKISIRAGVRMFGFVGDMPFAGGTVRDQIRELREMAEKLDTDDVPSAKWREEELYKCQQNLRKVVERFAEEHLLNNVVARHQPNVNVSGIPRMFAEWEKKKHIADKLKALFGDSSEHMHGMPFESAGVPPTPTQFRDAVQEFQDIADELDNLWKNREKQKRGG